MACLTGGRLLAVRAVPGERGRGVRGAAVLRRTPAGRLPPGSQHLAGGRQRARLRRADRQHVQDERPHQRGQRRRLVAEQMRGRWSDNACMGAAAGGRDGGDASPRFEILGDVPRNHDS